MSHPGSVSTKSAVPPGQPSQKVHWQRSKLMRIPGGAGSISGSQPSRPTNVGHHSSPMGSTASLGHGRYGSSPTPLNMSDMAYTLPSHQSQAPPFERQPLPHHYLQSAHPTDVIYPMLPAYLGQNTAGNMAYGVPFAPAYPTYGVPQHEGSAPHHGSANYQPYVSNLSVHTAPGPGQAPVYGPYYSQAPYTAPFGHGTHISGAPMRPQTGLQSHAQGQSTSPTSRPSSARREVQKKTTELEYDVSKTIVDGSNPMKLAQTQPQLSGEWLRRCLA